MQDAGLKTWLLEQKKYLRIFKLEDKERKAKKAVVAKAESVAVESVKKMISLMTTQ